MSVIRNQVGSHTPNRPGVGGGRRSQAGQRVSRFIFVVNNWTEEEYSKITEDFALQTKWLIVAKEKGDKEGTPHLQGACVLGKQWTWGNLKKVPGLERAHLEIMKGTPQDSLDYCSKDDPHPFVHGELPSPGKRNDLRLATDRILAGASVRELARDPEAATCVVKFHKGLTVLRSLNTPKRTEKPIVVWMYGPTGTGKTRCALKSGRAVARAIGRGEGDLWMSSGGLRWFDGYDGQTVAVLDDIRSKLVGSFAFFLRLLDRYPMDVEFKGGFVAWVPRVIFVTCPYSPDECFATRATHIPEDIAQLQRRISWVVKVDEEYDKANRAKFVEEVFALLPRRAEPQQPAEEVVEEMEEEIDEDTLDPDFLL